MQERLKHRLVGAAVVMTVVVAIVPELLDDSDNIPVSAVETALQNQPDNSEFNSSITSLDDDNASVRKLELPKMTVREQPSEVTLSLLEPDSEVSLEALSELSNEAVESDTPALTVSTTEPSQTQPASETVESANRDGWVVQLGSFSKRENALALTQKLQKMGYAAFAETGKSAQGNVTRVFVGPDVSKLDSDGTRAKLEAEIHLKGIVVKYSDG